MKRNKEMEKSIQGIVERKVAETFADLKKYLSKTDIHYSYMNFSILIKLSKQHFNYLNDEETGLTLTLDFFEKVDKILNKKYRKLTEGISVCIPLKNILSVDIRSLCLEGD